MKISRALQSNLLDRIRHILRTATDYTRWWARFALVELLIVSIVVLPSVPARGGFPNGNGDYTIWVDAGRASDGFAIYEGTDVSSPTHFPNASVAYPGASVTGNYASAPNGMVIRDLTTARTQADLPHATREIKNLAYVPRALSPTQNPAAFSASRRISPLN